MERIELAVRIDPDNPNHHLWNNHGTWWIHYTVYPNAWSAERVRRSLGTRSLEEARGRRDQHLAALVGTQEHDAPAVPSEFLS